MTELRILLLADSHLGFDLPLRPRVERRRRGHDFLANYARALAPVLAGEVDIVIHAGDVFDRSSVVPALAYQAFEPLRRIADTGIPVLIVPGNHERSRLPHLRLAQHPEVHVFAAPRTVVINTRGLQIAFSGFPYERHDVRSRFTALLEETAWARHPADVRILCFHHCVEGATVGPTDYQFTTASDVIRTRDIPPAFDVVLSGHIHRHQVLTADLGGRPLPTPVIYPGSIERTALAEIGETKGFITLTCSAATPRVRWEFHELPARPMVRKELTADGLTPAELRAAVEAIMGAAPADAVLSIRVLGTLTTEQWRVLSSPRLRALQPEMNVEIVPDRPFDPQGRSPSHTRSLAIASTVPPAQLTLELPSS